MMNTFKCNVCSQDLSPKKRRSLKCQNKTCNSQCHYGCDSEIQNSKKAQTIDKYYCSGCREGGDSIKYKKEHFTRSSSFSKKTSPNNEVITQSNGTLANTESNSSDEKSQDNSKELESPSYPDSATENVPTLPENIDSRTNVKNNTPAKENHYPEVINEQTPTDVLNTSTQSETQAPIENSKQPSTELHKENGSTKEKDKVILNKNIKINELEELLNRITVEKNHLKKQLTEAKKALNDQKIELLQLKDTENLYKDNQWLTQTIEMKNEQLKLMKDSLASEVEHRSRLQAKLTMQEIYAQKLQQKNYQLNGLIDTDFYDQQTQTNFENGNNNAAYSKRISELTDELQRLSTKNSTLININHEQKKELQKLKNESNLAHQKIEIESKDLEIRSLQSSLRGHIHKLERINDIIQDAEASPHIPSDPQTPSSALQPNGQMPYRSTPSNHSRNHQPEDSHIPSDPQTPTSPIQPNGQMPNRYTPSNHSNNHQPEDGYSPVSEASLQTLDVYDEQERSHSSINQSVHDGERTSNLSQRFTDEHERNKIDKKRKNIVILGLPEMDSNRDSLKEFIKINKYLGNRHFSKHDVRHCGRVGEPMENKPRPLKIELYDMIDKLDIMRNAYYLKDHPRYSNLSIQHDLTTNQITKLSELKNQARTLESNESTGEFIFRVRGPPGNWRIDKLPKN